MEILTVYVGQGDLAVVRHGNEAHLVDSRVPDTDEVSAESVEKKIRTMTDGRRVVGLVLTSFDADHADPFGLDLLLDRTIGGTGSTPSLVSPSPLWRWQHLITAPRTVPTPRR